MPPAISPESWALEHVEAFGPEQAHSGSRYPLRCFGTNVDEQTVNARDAGAVTALGGEMDRGRRDDARSRPTW